MQLFARRAHLSPTSQVAIALLLIIVFVYGRWLLVGDDFGGGIAQCAPVALLAALLLDRVYAVLTIVAATAAAFLLYFEATPADYDNIKFYLAVILIALSLAIIVGVAWWLSAELAMARWLCARQEDLNEQLRQRLAQNFRTVLSLCPDSAGFASADEYRREWTARLGALAGAAEILRHDIEQQAILPDLVETAVLPFAPQDQITIRLPRCTLPRMAVVALGLALQGLATASLRAGALSERDGHVGLSGSLLADGTLELVWCELGARAASPAHLAALESGGGPAAGNFANIRLHTEPGEYSCTITIAGAEPR